MRFNDLSRIERFAASGLLAFLSLTFVELVVPGIAGFLTFFLMVSVAGVILIPVVFFAPIVSFYGVLFAVPWWLLRNRSKLAGGLAGTGLCAAVAFGVPHFANQKFDQRWAAIKADEQTSRLTIAPTDTVALLTSRGDGTASNEVCWDWCQRLLLSDTATAVLQGDAEAFPAGMVARFRVMPHALPCPKVRLLATRADADELPRGAQPYSVFLIEKFAGTWGDGRCLVEDRVRARDADVVLMTRFNPDTAKFARASFDYRLGRLDLTMDTSAWRKRSGEFVRVFHHADYNAQRMVTPLQPGASFAFDTYSPGGWAVEASRHSPWTMGNRLQHIFTNDLRVTGIAPDERSTANAASRAGLRSR